MNWRSTSHRCRYRVSAQNMLSAVFCFDFVLVYFTNFTRFSSWSLFHFARWRHQMETFSTLLDLCAGNFTGHKWIPLTKTSEAELWCFLWSATEQRLSKQSRRRWFETPSRSLWRHCNVFCPVVIPANSILLCYAWHIFYNQFICSIWSVVKIGITSLSEQNHVYAITSR